MLSVWIGYSQLNFKTRWTFTCARLADRAELLWRRKCRMGTAYKLHHVPPLLPLDPLATNSFELRGSRCDGYSLFVFTLSPIPTRSWCSIVWPKWTKISTWQYALIIKLHFDTWLLDKITDPILTPIINWFDLYNEQEQQIPQFSQNVSRFEFFGGLDSK